MPAGDAMMVELTLPEVYQAATVGIMRQICNMQKQRQGAHGIAEDDPVWQCNVEGCCGELAVAKALGVYWSGALGKLRVPDVGKYQVRTRSKLFYDLILRPDDNDHAIFILVLGQAPIYDVVGWILASDGKRPEYWTSPNGRPKGFFVPRGVLRPMEELPEVTR